MCRQHKGGRKFFDEYNQIYHWCKEETIKDQVQNLEELCTCLPTKKKIYNHQHKFRIKLLNLTRTIQIKKNSGNPTVRLKIVCHKKLTPQTNQCPLLLQESEITRFPVWKLLNKQTEKITNYCHRQNFLRNIQVILDVRKL